MGFQDQDIIAAYNNIRGQINFAYDLKDKQVSALVNISNKQHTLAVLPTGYGKSDIFILAPLILNQLVPDKKHISLVVVPLLSLMADICQKYSERGIKVFQMKKLEELTPEDELAVRTGQYSTVLFSPEGIQDMEQFRDICWDNPIYVQGVCTIAIDEAHLLIQWGDKFRPSYQSLGELRSFFEEAPVLLTTATCPEDIRTRMLDMMGCSRPGTVKTIAVLPDRPNIVLHYHHKHAPDMEDALEWYLAEMAADGLQTKKAIIYCRSLKMTGRGSGMIVFTLREAAFGGGQVDFKHKMISVYHAEVDESNRQRILDEFRKPDSTIRCLVSTVAFGMGIDIPDIRYVIHWGESDTVSHYWQEVGCGGRDGEHAEAHLYHRQLQVNLCQEDMKSFVNEVSSGGCIRNSVMKRLMLEGMESCGSAATPDPCCSVCLEKKSTSEETDMVVCSDS